MAAPLAVSDAIASARTRTRVPAGLVIRTAADESVLALSLLLIGAGCGRQVG
jgi:hypothetical protein